MLYLPKVRPFPCAIVLCRFIGRGQRVTSDRIIAISDAYYSHKSLELIVCKQGIRTVIFYLALAEALNFIEIIQKTKLVPLDNQKIQLKA